MKKILLFSAVFVFSLTAMAKHHSFDILWAKNPSPPFHILEGELEDYGICDVLVDKLNAQLPESEIGIEVYPQSRIRKLVEGTENLCFPCMIKRSDNERFVYTESTMTFPPLGIIIRRDKLSEAGYNEGQALSLATLLDNKQLMFGYAEARRFPDTLQSLVDAKRDAPQMNVLAGILGPKRVLQQISKNRLHYTLDYPSVLRYFEITETDQSMRYIPTAEYGESGVPGAIGCTNNQWGKQAVSAINNVLPIVLADPEYIENQRFWMNAPPLGALSERAQSDSN